MKAIFLKVKICTFFIVLASISSCKGQTDTGTRTPDRENTAAERKRRLSKNHFYNDDKEASDNVHCGLQDRSGNMWFGTTGNGVYRYDGKTFINFTRKDGLAGNCVWSVLEDRAGHIWFGTDAGLCLYDGKKIIDVPFAVAKGGDIMGLLSVNKGSSPKNEVFSLMQDKNGVIWVGTTEGVYCYNYADSLDGRLFTSFPGSGVINESGLTLKSVQCIFQDKNSNIWFGSGPMAFEGIVMFDGKKLDSFRPKNETWIRNILQDKKGNIWFGTRHYGGLLYDGKAFTFFTEKASIGNPMLEDSQGNIWFGGEEKNGT